MKCTFTNFLFALVLLVLSLGSIQSFGATFTINVFNFGFSAPSPSGTIRVGDVINFNWTGGFHNVSFTSVPTGASAVGSGSPTSTMGVNFSYTVTKSGTYSYQCDPHAPNMASSFTANTILSTDLIVFSGFMQEDKKSVLLKWQTLSETNNERFEIEKSTNGTQFTTIGTVKGSGNSNEKRDYQFLDSDFSGSSFYRLKQTDFDGSTTYTDIITLKFPFANDKIYVFPNPSTSGIFNVEFHQHGHEIWLTDLMGKTVYTHQAAHHHSDTDVFEQIDINHLKKGIYFIHISTSNSTVVEKIIY